MTCPFCGKASSTEIDLHFGETINMKTFAFGNEYLWVPRITVQNGGRPPEGRMDGEGYAECPDCRQGYYVKVTVRNDRIESVSADREKTESYRHREE
jgi:hypothetical protein